MGFECDVTYSTGVFYKNIPAPPIKLDVLPEPGVIQADVRNLPLAAASVSNVVFDPPFLCGSHNDGIMKKRFGNYRTTICGLCTDKRWVNSTAS
jgi:hypothetical protein